MPDVLQDRGPWRDSDAGADENSDLVLEDVLSGSTVGSVDAQLRHFLTVGKSDLVHAHGVETVIFLSLFGTTSESITKSFGEVSHLADMHGDIWVEGT